jgi:hypothetical protein
MSRVLYDESRLTDMTKSINMQSLKGMDMHGNGINNILALALLGLSLKAHLRPCIPDSP